MHKKVLIFGIGGFVGPYLANEFHTHGYEVYGTDLIESLSIPEYVRFTMCDLLSDESVDYLIKDVKPDYIINLAAVSNVGLSWKIPQKTIAVNVEGSINILEAIRKHTPEARILLIGSSEEYEPSDEPIDEHAKLNANNPYGISKIMQEQFAKLYSERYGLKIYHVRAFNHTGVGQSDTFVIPSWCKQAAEISKSGKPGVMKVGNLDVWRDFSDVRDVVRAYRMVIESEYTDNVFNVGSGVAYSLKDILDQITSLSSENIIVEINPDLYRPADNAYIACSCQFIKSMLHWSPEISLSRTLKDVYTSFSMN